MKVIYLVAEFPVLSETFVYEEIRGLRNHGLTAELFALRGSGSADSLVPDIRALGIVYDGGALAGLVPLVGSLCLRPRQTLSVIGNLLGDLSKLSDWQARAKAIGQFIASAKLAVALRSEKADHLHIQFIHSPAQVGMYAALLAEVPYTVTAHANDIFCRGQLLVEKATRAKRLITISHFNKRYFEQIGVPAEHIEVVRCLYRYREKQSDSRVASPFVFASLGRMVPKKGFLTLIRAFAALCKSEAERSGSDQVPFRLEIGGYGPLEQCLKEEVEALGVAHSVTFTGAIAPGDVEAWLDGMDCFVLACEQGADGDIDGIPVVLMEAFARHCPVISTRLSGIPELVEHEKSGLLVQPADVKGLSEAMQRMAEDPSLRRSCVRNAQDCLTQEFSTARNLQRLLGVLGTG